MKCQIYVGYHANVRLDLAHVMQLQAQNVHNITQSVYGHQQDVFGHTRHILDGQMGIHEKKTTTTTMD
jgi:hypothetical protein